MRLATRRQRRRRPPFAARLIADGEGRLLAVEYRGVVIRRDGAGDAAPSAHERVTIEVDGACLRFARLRDAIRFVDQHRS